MNPSTLPDVSEREPVSDMKTLVHLYHYGFCNNGCYKSPRDKWDQLCEARAAQYERKLESFIHSHIQVVIGKDTKEPEVYGEGEGEWSKGYRVGYNDRGDEARQRAAKYLGKKEDT